MTSTLENVGQRHGVWGEDVAACYLRRHGFAISDRRTPVTDRAELPPICLLSLETPRCWHWSLFCGGTFYDPEHGVMQDFPDSARRYYWEIKAP